MTFPESMDRSGDLASPQNTGHTPLQLVRRQVKDRDFHVSDEDMANLIISDELPAEEKLESETEADGLKRDKAATSYEVLD